MRVDGLNRQELFERVGFDRRDRIDRGIVDEKIEAARGGDESFGFPLQNRQIVLNSVPDRHHVDEVVAVNQRVTHSIG